MMRWPFVEPTPCARGHCSVSYDHCLKSILRVMCVRVRGGGRLTNWDDMVTNISTVVGHSFSQ